MRVVNEHRPLFTHALAFHEHTGSLAYDSAAGWGEAYDVVTYWYGPQYHEQTVQRSFGAFIECHDFSQTMTPLTPDAGGYP